MLTLGLAASTALAQSNATLETVRLHRTDALNRAQAEWESCRAAKSSAGAEKPCARERHLALLVGYLALSEGNTDLASKALDGAAPPQLAAFHAFYLGETQFYRGDYEAAAKSFERVAKNAPAWLSTKVLARHAEALFAAGEIAQAGPLLEKAALAIGTPELFHQRSLARRRLGNLDGHKADLLTLALRFPGHPYAAEALMWLKVRNKGRPYPFTFQERLLRASGLLEAKDFAAALFELDQAEKLAKGATARARLSLSRASVLFAAGSNEEAENALDRALTGPASVAAEAAMLRARRLMRADENRKAREAMTQIDRKYPKEPAALDAAFLVGWLDLQGGQLTDAVKAFASYEERYPRSRKLDEAMWYRALASIRLGRFADADLALTGLVARFPRSSLVPQAQYWIARSNHLRMPAGSTGADPTPVIEGYQRVRTLFPGTFYAVLATERLRELGREVVEVFPPPKALEVAVPKELELALALAKAGLFRDAGEEVKNRLATARTARKALELGHALQSLGEFGHAHALAARHLWAAAYGERQPEALALMYPLAFRQSVERAAKEQSLDPYFTWAIMRRESAFRPEVASAADARGLMQLIPPTAKAIAQELSLPLPNPDELFSPELNITMASWYLSALLRRFGHPALSAAAYNAGPQAVVRWATEKGSLPLDLWVEEIPYKETRAYVKQVMADYDVYRSLYGGKAPPSRLSLTVPAPLATGVSF
ncbi:MAG: transglycosylase SLT domain-containing protein [Myxococcota bacterium]